MTFAIKEKYIVCRLLRVGACKGERRRGGGVRRRRWGRSSIHFRDVLGAGGGRSFDRLLPPLRMWIGIRSRRVRLASEPRSESGDTS